MPGEPLPLGLSNRVLTLPFSDTGIDRQFGHARTQSLWRPVAYAMDDPVRDGLAFHRAALHRPLMVEGSLVAGGELWRMSIG